VRENINPFQSINYSQREQLTNASNTDTHRTATSVIQTELARTAQWPGRAPDAKDPTRTVSHGVDTVAILSAKGSLLSGIVRFFFRFFFRSLFSLCKFRFLHPHPCGVRQSVSIAGVKKNTNYVPIINQTHSLYNAMAWCREY
jgi:hypothetical protein